MDLNKSFDEISIEYSNIRRNISRVSLNIQKIDFAYLYKITRKRHVEKI